MDMCKIILYQPNYGYLFTIFATAGTAKHHSLVVVYSLLSVFNSRFLRASAMLKHVLFHDLLRLPILHHYVWSEITGHNSLQRQRQDRRFDPPRPTNPREKLPICILQQPLFWCFCDILLLSNSAPLKNLSACLIAIRQIRSSVLLVHVKALNRTTKTILLMLQFTIFVRIVT